MLSQPFQRFIEASPVTVMLRGIVERTLNAEWLDAWFERTAESQYTRELLFSTVFDLMLQVVCGVRRTVGSAYQAHEHTIPVSIQAVYDKLKGIEPATAAELVREQAQQAEALIEALEGARPPLLSDYRVKILDGNCLEASERRLKELRRLSAAPLPGKSLVVYDPALEVATDVVPCEDGHAQERALLGTILARVTPDEAWVGDRNFCVRSFLQGLEDRNAFFVIREHKQLPFKPREVRREIGPTETGLVSEQRIEVHDEHGQARHWRRIRVQLKKPTREGEHTLFIWSNLPASIEARTLADVYRKRWTLETAFQHLEHNLNGEINTLAYPRAVLFGFCIALVAYNTLAILQAALRRGHGAEQVDPPVSGYYLAEEISATYQGMMIALPPPEWEAFAHLPVNQMATWLIDLAQHVRLPAFRKHQRGPKKPQPKRQHNPKQPHVSTAKLIAERRRRA
jgi:IS4 transposase